MKRRFIVTQKIEEGWQTGAEVGDVLTLENWKCYDSEFPMLMKDGKAVCEVNSDFTRERCIEEGAFEVIKQKIRIPVVY